MQLSSDPQLRLVRPNDVRQHVLPPGVDRAVQGVGWSVHETTGANPFVLKFYNGADTGQDVISIAGGGGGAVDSKWFSGGGISFTEGLFVAPVVGGGRQVLERIGSG